MTRIRSTYLALLAVLLSPMAAQANIIAIATFDGVNIDGIVYDVAMLDNNPNANFLNSFNDIFGAGTPTLTFTTLESAQMAMDIVLDVAAVAGFFDGFVFAFSFDVTNFDYITGFPDVDQQGGPFTTTRTNPLTAPFVAFTRVSVPEPGTLALLGIGLAGLGLARRRRKV